MHSSSLQGITHAIMHRAYTSLLGSMLIMLLCLTMNSAHALTHTPEAQLSYAQNLHIEHFPTHRLITVKNINRHSTESFQYALVPKGQEVPKLPKGTLVVRTPVERVVVMATTFVGYIDALDLHDTLVGVATPGFINNAEVHQRLDAGQIKTVQTGQSLDMESMLLLRPDLILTSSTGNPRFDVHPQLARSGLPIVLSASYMEQHPLARAEWIKFIAAFFDKSDEADAVFKGVEQRYHQLVADTKDIQPRPTVFCSAPYAGAWYVPGGLSYMGKALADAGADYLWADDTTAGGIPLDFERVFFKAANADIWLNPSSYRDLHSLYQADQRFKRFKAAKSGEVYNNSKQFNATGGNNIWERGIVHPDEVLADMIKVFHPDLAKDHTFIYYEQLD
jgi:iron complex transport system substrate-binding protein